METRLVLFIFFLLVTAGLISLKGYRSEYNPADTLKASLEPKKEETQVAAAEGSAPKEFVLELNTPALKNGHAIYTGKGNCVQCHGEKAEGVTAQQGPMIAGQYDWYMADQITQIKSGARSNPKMQPFASALSEQEIKDVAHYVSNLRLRK